MELNGKSSSYLFWLSEYLARKLLINIGSNAIPLLYFFEIGEIESKGLIENTEYHPTPKDIATFIRSNAWMSLDAKRMQDHGFLEQFLKSLPTLEDEIDKLVKYILANEREIEITLGLRAAPTAPNYVIRACIRKSFPRIMAQRFHDAARAFTNTTITMHDSGENSQRVGCSGMKIEHGGLHMHKISIDLAANLEDILADVTLLVCKGRMLAREAERGNASVDFEPLVCESWGCEDWDNEDWDSCLGYGSCSDGRCQVDERYSLDAKVLRKAREIGNNYLPRSDNARATGLWLWDYVKKNDCSVGEAVRFIRGKMFLKQLQFSDSPDRVLERLHARTRECINIGAVISMR